jgi:hypothetical protein
MQPMSLRRSLAGLLFAILCAASARPAPAATFVVTNTSTSGAGSLAKAIADANLTTDPDVIHFDINSMTPVLTIGGLLPAITQPLTIDGYSQPGSFPNSAENDTNNAVLRIEIDASAVPVSGAALDIQGEDATIRGIAIKNIPVKAIGIEVGAASFAKIEGCFIGTGASGLADASNGSGIVVRGLANLGGSGVDDRNLISGHNAAGIQLSGLGMTMLNNFLGVDRNGNPTLGNGTGVVVSASTILSSIGGSSSATRNVITDSTNAGFRIASGATGSFAFGVNRIFGNGGLGIDLGADGVTLNDEGDVDTGPNGRQNFPEITFAVANAGTLSLEGHLESQPGTYRINVFRNAEADPSGFGEGETFLGTFEAVIPEGETRVDFDASIALGIVGLNEGFLVSTTAENVAIGATSEFSRTVDAIVGGPRLVVTNTNDSGPGSLREAIDVANGQDRLSTIAFDIPGDGPHTIVPATGLLASASIIIDGYSQPGASPNTLEEGTNAVPGVVIDGSLASDQTKVLLGFAGSGTIVRGIGVHSAPATAIAFGTNDKLEGGALEGSFIGVDPTGTAKIANAGTGVLVGTPCVGFVVGGTSRDKRNLVSGNGRAGIQSSGLGTVIVNNLVGSDATGNAALGNVEAGIDVRGFAATIGSDDPALGNRVIGNGEAGIVIRQGAGHEVRANSITGNAGLGIDILEEEVGVPGVTENDEDDTDGSTNGQQNFPVLVGVDFAPGTTKVEVFLDVPPLGDKADYTLRFYDNESCDDSGHGEGAVFVGKVDVELSSDGETFLVDLPVDPGESHVITATVTEVATGNTSEFSECLGGGIIEPPSVCGDASADGEVSAADGQRALRAAVGAAACDACRCDVNLSNSISTSDALLILRVGVGQQIELNCPPCP